VSGISCRKRQDMMNGGVVSSPEQPRQKLVLMVDGYLGLVDTGSGQLPHTLTVMESLTVHGKPISEHTGRQS